MQKPTIDIIFNKYLQRMTALLPSSVVVNITGGQVHMNSPAERGIQWYNDLQW